MRACWFQAVLFCSIFAQVSPAQAPSEKPKVVDPLAEAKKLPPELDALNIAARKIYSDAKSREIASIPAVIFLSGDELVLRKGGKRFAVKVIPSEYHVLKSISHTTLALFGHLSEQPGMPISEERLKSLKQFQVLVGVAEPIVDKFGFDPDTLARQKRLLSKTNEIIFKVLKDGQISSDDLIKYCRALRADVSANGAAAAKLQLKATHRQVMEWKKDLTADEWSSLTVIIPGNQTARAENAAVQYFARLFGESPGEGRRVVYAESIWEEDKALGLLGTLRLDGKLADAVFGDRFRMYRDFLADPSRAIIDELLAPE